MWDVIILAIALSMDAFAVSIGLGAKTQATLSAKVSNAVKFSLKVGLYFGVFQGVMPLIGFLGGHSLFNHGEHPILAWIVGHAHIIAFLLLMFIGLKMIYEAFSDGVEEEISQVTSHVLFILAIATSIDAMAAGFSLPLIDFNPYLACLIIGVITFFMSIIGVFAGKSGATWLESKAEFLGGVVLVLIAIKLLVVG